METQAHATCGHEIEPAVSMSEHTALLYRGPREFLAGTMPFILSGLAVAEPVVVAVPGPNLRLLGGELTAQVGAAAKRVRLVDMGRDGRNPGWIIPGLLRAFTDAHPAGRVRVITEPIWPGRTEAEYPACVQHEALVNLAFGGREVMILCPYDAMGLRAPALADAAATHPVLIDGREAATGGVRGGRTSGRYAPERMLAACNVPLPEPGAPVTELAFEDADLERVRELTLERAGRAGLRGERAGDVELAVNELAVNTLMHGGGRGTLRIWAQDGHLSCEVSDAGHITDPLVGRCPVDPGTPGGRGVLLVNHLADLVRVHTGADGTTIRAQFAL